MTVTYCNEVTPLDQLPKVPTLWEEEEEEKDQEDHKGKARREDTDLVRIVSKVVCTVL